MTDKERATHGTHRPPSKARVAMSPKATAKVESVLREGLIAAGAIIEEVDAAVPQRKRK